MDIPIKAVLGQSVISVMDFASLQVGDIIRLDRGVEDEMDVYVGNIKKFTALPGVNKDKYAVRGGIDEWTEHHYLRTRLMHY